MTKDPIVDAVDRAHRRLLKRHGGVHGLIEHLQAMDRARVRRTEQRAAKASRSATSNGRRPKHPKSRNRVAAEPRSRDE